MKQAVFILLIFVVFYCCLAKKEDSDHLLLDENSAKRFLKRDMCHYYQDKAEQVREREGGVKGFLISKADVKEECCGETCDAEEMYENMHIKDEGSYEQAEYNREQFVYYCCN